MGLPVRSAFCTFLGALLLTACGQSSTASPTPTPDSTYRYRTGDLIYHGGLVQSASTTYAIFWKPRGLHFEPGHDVRYEHLIQRFLRDVNDTSYYNLLTQYSYGPASASPTGAWTHAVVGGPIRNQSTFGGQIVDTRPYPHPGTASDPLLYRDIFREVERITRSRGWTPGVSHNFFVYLAGAPVVCTPDRALCTPGFGGDHVSFRSHGKAYVTAIMPDIGLYNSALLGTDPTGDPYAGFTIFVTAHELFEMVTEPLPGVDGTGDEHAAWNAGDVNFKEIADVCRKSPGIVTLHHHRYRVPAMYSNTQHGCAFAYPPSASF